MLLQGEMATDTPPGPWPRGDTTGCPRSLHQDSGLSHCKSFVVSAALSGCLLLSELHAGGYLGFQTYPETCRCLQPHLETPGGKTQRRKTCPGSLCLHAQLFSALASGKCVTGSLAVYSFGARGTGRAPQTHLAANVPVAQGPWCRVGALTPLPRISCSLQRVVPQLRGDGVSHGPPGRAEGTEHHPGPRAAPSVHGRALQGVSPGHHPDGQPEEVSVPSRWAGLPVPPRVNPSASPAHHPDVPWACAGRPGKAQPSWD